MKTAEGWLLLELGMHYREGFTTLSSLLLWTFKISRNKAFKKTEATVPFSWCLRVNVFLVFHTN